MTTKMVTTKIVLNSQMGQALRAYLEAKGFGEVEGYVAKEGYRKHWREADNLITWGVKWKSSHYKRNKKNVLFLENGLICQRRGIYIDHEGYFVDSSLVREERNLAPYSAEEETALWDFFQSAFKWERSTVTHDPKGPILVALQMNGDAPMRHHFPLAKTPARKQAFLEALARYLPKGKEVIVRCHPREKTLPDAFGPLPKKWRVENEGKIYDILPTCSALVTVNSTVATEGLGIPSLPIATFGLGSFTGTGATLDCSRSPVEVSNILDHVPDREAATRYLCAIMRNHQIAYRRKNFTEIFDQNEPLQKFIERRRDPSATQPRSKVNKKLLLKTCVYCAMDTPNSNCPRCKCIHCNKPRC